MNIAANIEDIAEMVEKCAKKLRKWRSLRAFCYYCCPKCRGIIREKFNKYNKFCPRFCPSYF